MAGGSRNQRGLVALGMPRNGGVLQAWRWKGRIQVVIELLAAAVLPLMAVAQADTAPQVAVVAAPAPAAEPVPATPQVAAGDAVVAPDQAAPEPVPAVTPAIDPAAAAVGVTAADPAATPAPDAAQATPAATETVGADIVVMARENVPGDPIAQINAQTYAVAQAVDEAVIAPIAMTYAHGVPLPVRQGLHNFLNNLDEPIVFVNFLLQLKPGKALRTVGRFAINSTLGLGGLLDVAKKPPFNLPRRSNGLADTLGYYGVGPGPYLFLPIIGSTTVRDLAARPFDLMLLPALAPAPFRDPTVAFAKGAGNALDERVNFDEDLRRLREESDSPYDAVRDYYLRRRQAEIDFLRGRGPAVDNPDFEWAVKPVTRRPAPAAEAAPAVVEPSPVQAPAVEPAPAPAPAPVPNPATDPVPAAGDAAVPQEPAQ